TLRQGAEVRSEYYTQKDTIELWLAVRERIGELHGNKAKVPWNIWLQDGKVKTALSLFEHHSAKIDKAEASRLQQLNGQNPMDLVLQRVTRETLLRQVKGADGKPSPWRVQPELLRAVEEAILAYHAERSPLYPLPEMQRLGYLDEEDSIT